MNPKVYSRLFNELDYSNSNKQPTSNITIYNKSNLLSLSSEVSPKSVGPLAAERDIGGLGRVDVV